MYTGDDDLASNGSNRRIAFNVLLAAHVALALLAAGVWFGQFNRPPSQQAPWLAGFKFFEDLFGVDYERPVFAVLPALALIVVYLLTYAASLNGKAAKRPTVRLFILHAVFAAAVVFSLAAMIEMSFVLMTAAVVGAGAAWAFALIFLEKMAGRILEKAAAWLTARERWGAANQALAGALLFMPGDARLQRALGFSRYESGDVPGALEVLGPLSAPGCDDPQLLRVAQTCFQTERVWDEAVRTNRQLMELNPSDLDARLRAAQALEELNRREEALVLMREAIASAPPAFLEQLVRMHLRAKDERGALEAIRRLQEIEAPPRPKTFRAFDQALHALGEAPALVLQFAEFLIDNRKREEGHALLEQVLEHEPHRHALRRRLVEFYREENMIEMAEPHLSALMDAGEDTAEMALLYGDVLMERRDHEQALMHFQYAVENHPEDYRFPFYLAQISLRSDALEDAKFWCEEAERRLEGKDDPEGEQRIGNLRERVEDGLFSREIHVLRERVERDPDNLDLRLNLLAAMSVHGMADDAASEYDALLERRPELAERILGDVERAVSGPAARSFRLLDFLADLKVRARRWDEALETARRLAELSLHAEELMLEHCRRILHAEPNHVASMRCLVETLADRAAPEELVEAYERLKELGEELDPAAAPPVMEAYVAANRFEDAFSLGESCIARDPHDLSMRIRLVRAYRAAERYDEAIEHLNAARNIDFYDPDVVRLMGEVSRERREKRLTALAERLETDPADPAAHVEAGDLRMEAGETQAAASHYQHAVEDQTWGNLARAKLAQAMARMEMFDLADETLDEVHLSGVGAQEQRKIKALVYAVAEMLQKGDEPDRSLKHFKRLFRVDASYRKVVDKIEELRHL